MKKIIAMLLAVMMVVGLFAACGTKAPETTAPVETTPVETQPVETEPVAGEIPTLIWYQVGGGQPVVQVQVVQAGDVCAAQPVVCHFLVLQAADVAADLGNEHGKGLVALVHEDVFPPFRKHAC